MKSPMSAASARGVLDLASAAAHTPELVLCDHVHTCHLLWGWRRRHLETEGPVEGSSLSCNEMKEEIL